MATYRALQIISLCMWVVFWATETEANIRSRVFSKYANGFMLTPNVTLNVDRILNCAMACGTIPICMGYSVTPNQNSSSTKKQTFTCRLGFGTFQWIYDAASILHGVDIGPLNGYTFQKDGRFYKKYTEKLGFPAALRACDAEGAAAADAFGQEAYGILRNLMLPDTPQILQGMYRTSDHSIGRWITFRGIEFFAKGTGDPNQLWSPGEPSNDQCATMGTTNNNQALPLNWDADVCGRTSWPLPRICQKPIGYERARNGKYYKMHYETTSSFAEARAICGSEGGNLANLLTQANYDSVEVYRVRANFGGTSFRIDGTDEGHEGQWTLADGTTTLRTQDIPNWGSTEPNGNGRENCLVYSESLRGLIDVACGEVWRYMFLCEIVP